MILADTTIWVDHFHNKERRLRDLLNDEQIVMHPYVASELALGSLPNRLQTLKRLDELIQLHVVPLRDVRDMIEARKLYAKGIGLTDAQLLASCLKTSGTQLWTADERLRKVAVSLDIGADLPL
jgi:predicted nucleic acid-binding protein